MKTHILTFAAFALGSLIPIQAQAQLLQPTVFPGGQLGVGVGTNGVDPQAQQQERQLMYQNQALRNELAQTRAAAQQAQNEAAQARQQRQAGRRPSYSEYGGPVSPLDYRRELESVHNGNWPYEFLSPQKVRPEAPDEVAEQDRQKAEMRQDAVEYGRYRNLFLGSTRFWLDEDQRWQNRGRFAMGESLWSSIHPPEEFRAGYQYNPASMVGEKSSFNAVTGVAPINE